MAKKYNKLEMPKKAKPMESEEEMDFGMEDMGEEEDMEEMDLDMLMPEEEGEPIMLTEASIEELEAELEKRKMEEEGMEDEGEDMEMEEPEEEEEEY